MESQIVYGGLQYFIGLYKIRVQAGRRRPIRILLALSSRISIRQCGTILFQYLGARRIHRRGHECFSRDNAYHRAEQHNFHNPVLLDGSQHVRYSHVPSHSHTEASTPPHLPRNAQSFVGYLTGHSDKNRPPLKNRITPSHTTSAYTLTTECRTDGTERQCHVVQHGPVPHVAHISNTSDSIALRSERPDACHGPVMRDDSRIAMEEITRFKHAFSNGALPGHSSIR